MVDMAEPSAEDVAQFASITGATPDQAVKFLRKYQNADTAIGHFFDNGGILPQEPQDVRLACPSDRSAYSP